MTLTDREILELHELCNAVVDDTLTGAQRTRLEAWLLASEEARACYTRAMDLSASLSYYASEMQMEAADARQPVWRFVSKRSWILAALAASLVIAGALWLTNRTRSNEMAAESTEYVARLTGTKSATWKDAATAPHSGDFLRRGQRLELASGFAEITFDSGAVVLLEGPAVFDLNSAWDSTLRRGTLTTNVPEQAIGFRVSNPAVDVVDVGTEFSMVADSAGSADVLVLKGAVEALPSGHEEEDVVLIQENESRRFARSGISGTENQEQLFAHFRTPVPLERPSKAENWLHWSFDHAPRENRWSGRVAGFSAIDDGLSLEADVEPMSTSVHSDGFRGQGLRFDGKIAARAAFPGISGNMPRTISFWVKVPADAPLSNAYSIVAWRGESKKLASRPVHIGWNRNPAEGPLGAIRTDFSGGHAMGTTPLRDGRWHHVSVIFLPGAQPESPVQVKQYVDGRLESNTVVPGPRRSVAANVKSEPAGPELTDVLWLGCRLGNSGPKKERFRGTIDELVVVNRGLEPAEVVQLMDGRWPLAD